MRHRLSRNPKSPLCLLPHPRKKASSAGSKRCLVVRRQVHLWRYRRPNQTPRRLKKTSLTIGAAATARAAMALGAKAVMAGLKVAVMARVAVAAVAVDVAVEARVLSAVSAQIVRKTNQADDPRPMRQPVRKLPTCRLQPPRTCSAATLNANPARTAGRAVRNGAANVAVEAAMVIGRREPMTLKETGTYAAMKDAHPAKRVPLTCRMAHPQTPMHWWVLRLREFPTPRRLRKIRKPAKNAHATATDVNVVLGQTGLIAANNSATTDPATHSSLWTGLQPRVLHQTVARPVTHTLQLSQWRDVRILLTGPLRKPTQFSPSLLRMPAWRPRPLQRNGQSMCLRRCRR